MKKAATYRQNAEECRRLAGRTEREEHRQQLLEMAESWEKLAADRSDLVRRHPELALNPSPADESGEEETEAPAPPPR